MTDNSNRITLATRLYAQYAEAVVFVMKCYRSTRPAKTSVLGLVFTAIARLMRSFAMRDKTKEPDRRCSLRS